MLSIPHDKDYRRYRFHVKHPDLPDRLRFVHWLAQLVVGCGDTSGSFALAIEKHPNQVSKWLNGSGMDTASAKHIAERVAGVDDLWLFDPSHPKAEAPSLFAQWWESQQRWRVAHPETPPRTDANLRARGFKSAAKPPTTKKAATRAANDKRRTR